MQSQVGDNASPYVSVLLGNKRTQRPDIHPLQMNIRTVLPGCNRSSAILITIANTGTSVRVVFIGRCLYQPIASEVNRIIALVGDEDAQVACNMSHRSILA